VLIRSPQGDVLLDGGPQDAAPLIAHNLALLGVRPSEVHALLNTHVHSDHAGGLAALKRLTGAELYARRAARPALESGLPDRNDPQYGLKQGFPKVRVDRLVRDGETIRVGQIAVKTIATPGHTPGGTSWSWRSCEDGRCVNIVYADSLSPISADGYRFLDHPALLAQFRSSIDKITALKCDILITPHPGASDLFERLSGQESLILAQGCANYAAAARKRLDERLRSEEQAPR
jgi:metallo-beta-lactamase class B